MDKKAVLKAAGGILTGATEMVHLTAEDGSDAELQVVALGMLQHAQWFCQLVGIPTTDDEIVAYVQAHPELLEAIVAMRSGNNRQKVG